MDKRFQVFVSSTFLDLQEERREVIQALLELDCIPSGMELFPAADEEQWSYIKKVIDDCDYYVLILAGRYGSINSKTGKSYTQMEYEYAVERGKPAIAFVHENPDALTVSKSEKSPEAQEKLDDFRKSIEKLYKKWNSAEQLGGLVSRSMVQLMKQRPAIGWVRADNLPDESAAQEIARLRRQIEKLVKKNKDDVSDFVDVASLSKGEDELELRFNFEARTYINEEYSEDEEFMSSIKISWDKIFKYIGPEMMDSIQKSQFISMLKKIIEENFTFDGNIVAVSVNSEDAQTILIQFTALGFIRKPMSGRWSLTEKGKQKVFALKSITK